MREYRYIRVKTQDSGNIIRNYVFDTTVNNGQQRAENFAGKERSRGHRVLEFLPQDYPETYDKRAYIARKELS